MNKLTLLMMCWVLAAPLAHARDIYTPEGVVLVQSTGGYTGYRGQDRLWPQGEGEPNYEPDYTIVCDAAGNCRPVVFGPNGQSGPVHPQSQYPIYQGPDYGE